ncbi:polysaccharide biosynthesis protein [Campylobacter sp. MIT 99-7217]|uniref:3'-5' exonuclease n=1 Tax=Campylobacter sp. MIT 99-7217 TaxID=535091 RepID=UPI00115A84D3|nr:3'-5' exonuclease [Campylobacter sp. MIT 99-7217]TQR33755.1 polysaccharide biosynthesis protein [Campylobacter sp. MIT 99-7217]
MKERQQLICIFDCESILDTELIRRVWNLEGEDFEVSKEAMKKQFEESASEFLPLPFHKVISICAVITDHFGKFIKVNKIEGESEAEMISNFFKFIDKFSPKLVSFNGKNYDMPLLVLRALKYNIKASTYLDTISDKWNNYKSRFNELKHCDLFESLGAGRGMRLDTICAMANLPGKYDVHGDQVLELFYQNELEKIHEYCESDVLNTFMLYLKYEFIKGNLTEEDYANSLSLMSEYLQEHKANRGYVDIFVHCSDEEIKRILEK